MLISNNIGIAVAGGSTTWLALIQICNTLLFVETMVCHITASIKDPGTHVRNPTYTFLVKNYGAILCASYYRNYLKE